jgi:biotin carboxylase
MHRRLHEVPWEGGVSSLRSSWWHEAIYHDALARVNYLDWNGVSMFEYRWNPSTDKFFLMELNARFWGSLHLPIHAGVDFPKLLVSAWNNEIFPIPEARIGVCCRFTFPKEIEYVISRLKSPKLNVGQKTWTLLEFAMLSLDPRIKSDMLFPGDNRLYWRSITNTVRKLMS